jgi:hypothetical protein
MITYFHVIKSAINRLIKREAVKKGAKKAPPTSNLNAGNPAAIHGILTAAASDR